MNDKTKFDGDTYYGDRARNYQSSRQNSILWAAEQQNMHALLNEIPDGLRVLDVPFGTGRFVAEFARKNFEIYGLDSSQDMLDQARLEIGDALYEQCNLKIGLSHALPYDDEAFDLVVSVRFLRDIISFADAKKSLAQFARVSKRYLILQLGEAMVAGGEHPQDDERMGDSLSRQEIEAFLRQYGFAILSTRIVFMTKTKEAAICLFLCEKR